MSHITLLTAFQNRFKMLLLLPLLPMLFGCENEPKRDTAEVKEVAEYINFIDHDHLSSKDYILSLFEKYDFVILCERDHRDITQYDLFYDIVSDPYFVENVGHVFLEIGVHNSQNRVQDFVLADGLSADERYQKLRDIQRYASYFPLWEKYNYSYFIEKIYELNQQLDSSQRISLYPSGLYMDWPSTKTFDDIKNNYQYATLKDSLMAINIMNDIDSLQVVSTGNNVKALMILNFHHAFNQKFLLEPSAGNFLFKAFPGKIANVLINNVKTLEDANRGVDIPLQDGKWDAAFKVKGNPEIGFNFANTPFGTDAFDFYPYEEHGYTYEDIFTGFVFYKPISDFELAIGFPGLLEEGFKEEYERRLQLFFQWRNNDSTIERQDAGDFLNSLHHYPADDLDTIQFLINKWEKGYLDSSQN